MELLTTQIKRIIQARRISMAVLDLVTVTAFTSGRPTAGDPKKAGERAENKLVGA
jgi:hypothetical protein